jgi:hypothetical protein
MRIVRVLLSVVAVVVSYVVCWHLFLIAFLVDGRLAGGSAHELRDAYANDVGQLFRVGGSELTDTLQRLALVIAIVGTLAVLILRVLRRRKSHGVVDQVHRS